jgi:predicted DNA-binding transcriptional regulator YafY
LIDLSGAIHASQRILIEYRSHHKEHTRRKVEPYGLTGWRGRWYMGGYCCLRQDYRVFRLDRIQHIEILSETFEKAEDFDYEGFIKREYNTGVQVEIEFHADLPTVQQKITERYGALTSTPTGILLQGTFDDLDGLARYLMMINLPFVVHNPLQLREALQRLGERMLQVAATEPIALTTHD